MSVSIAFFAALATFVRLHRSHGLLHTFLSVRLLAAYRVTHRVLLDVFTGKGFRQLLFVVGENTLAIFLQVGSFRVRHDCLEDLSPSLGTDEEAERYVLILVYIHLTTGKVLEE